MASCYTATDVVDMISDWEVSENEDEFGYEDVEDMDTADYQVDPLDIAQCVTCRTSSAETNTSSSEENSDCDTESFLPSSIPSSTRNLSLAFNPPPFLKNPGPLSCLPSTASPLDFFTYYLMILF